MVWSDLRASCFNADGLWQKVAAHGAVHTSEGQAQTPQRLTPLRDSQSNLHLLAPQKSILRAGPQASLQSWLHEQCFRVLGTVPALACP